MESMNIISSIFKLDLINANLNKAEKKKTIPTVSLLWKGREIATMARLKMEMNMLPPKSYFFIISVM
jgi:hypothetical protein